MSNRSFRIAVLAPFAAGLGQRPGRSVVMQGNIGAAAESLGDNCVLEIPRDLFEPGRIALPLLPPDGLEPDAWLQREPYLAALAAARSYLLEAERQGEQPEVVALQLDKRWPELSGGWKNPASSPSTETRNNPLGGLLDLVELPGEGGERHVQRSGPVVWREEIEVTLTAILRHLTAQPAYRERVVAWGGVSWLDGLAGENLVCKLIDADRTHLQEVVEALNSDLTDFAPDMVVVDLPFDRSTRDQESLAVLARLGDQLLAPVLAWVDRDFLGLDSWRELSRLPFLKNHLEQPAYAKWRSLCGKPEASWLCVTIGRFTTSGNTCPCEALGIELQLSDPVWVSPVWPAAALILDCYLQSGFYGPLTGRFIKPLPAGVKLEFAVSFSDDRHFQLVRSKLAPLARDGERIGFAAVPLAGSGSLDQQLFLRQLLSWLFAEQEQRPLPNGQGMQERLLRLFREAGVPAPVGFSLEIADGMLTLQLTPPAELVPAAEPVSLQLSWE